MLRYASTAWHPEEGLHVLYETTDQIIELEGRGGISRLFDQALLSKQLDTILSHFLRPVILMTYFPKVNINVTLLFLLSSDWSPYTNFNHHIYTSLDSLSPLSTQYIHSTLYQEMICTNN
jgi:hypothetical protein